MREDLHTEFKREWKDEYLRNVAALANTEGGTIYVGFDDKGNIFGVERVDHDLKVIPDKIQNVLGIVAIVDNHREGGKDYLTIKVNPSPEPILYDGKLFVKSGSTTRELKHAEARNYLVRKYGHIWTEDPCPSVPIETLDNGYFSDFKKDAVSAGKLHTDESRLSVHDLLDKLKLIVNDSPKLGAVLLFHPEPERFTRGAYVRIGMFRGSDILYEDRLSGPLYSMPDRILEIITSKYTIVPVEFEDITRIEKPPYPREALREIILNMIIHSDYGAEVEIQIKVFPDHIEFFNSGAPPDDWTVEYLLNAHRSVPGNPTFAEVFYRAGKVESFGRGIQKVMDQYKGRQAKPPVFKFDSSSFSVFIYSENPIVKIDPEIVQERLSDNQNLLLRSMTSNPVSISELMSFVSSSNRESFRRNILKPLLEKGYVTMTSKDSPNNPKQQYILTEKGWRFKEQR